MASFLLMHFREDFIKGRDFFSNGLRVLLPAKIWIHEKSEGRSLELSLNSGTKIFWVFKRALNGFRTSKRKLLGGGLEPPCLAACAPQTHVSAISPPELWEEILEHL